MTNLEWVGGPRPARRARNIVTRADGKMVNVNRQMGQLFVCRFGCCCGREEDGKPEGHFDLYHEEWERRRIRNQVHLNMAGCLGPCPLANVCMLLFEGTTTFFHSMNTEQRIVELYDYIETLVAEERWLPPPAALRDLAFSAVRTDGKSADPTSPPEEHDEAVTRREGILVLTHADTDVVMASAVSGDLDEQLPPLQVVNVAHLQDEAEAVAFFESVVPSAEIVLVKVYGGAAGLPGFQRLAAMIDRDTQWFVAMPATDDLDPELTAYSNTGVAIAHEAKAYLQLGGVENFRQCLYFLSDHLLATGIGYDPPAEQPRTGLYHPRVSSGDLDDWLAIADPSRPTVGLTFYRSYWLAGDTDFVDVLVEAGEAAGLNVLPVYAYSLKDDAAETGDGGIPAACSYFLDSTGQPLVDAVVHTMSFAMGASSPEDRAEDEWATEVLRRMDVPQLQAINAGITAERWQESENGLPPLDVAMNVAIPELDGRIIGVPVAFKEETTGPHGESVTRRGAVADRADRVMGMASRLASLRHIPPSEKRVAVVLTNHNAKAARIANAVGLDSPASLLELLGRLRDSGYTVGELPSDSDAMMALLVERGHYDRDLLTEEQLRSALARVPAERYSAWFAELPARRATEMQDQWGAPPGGHYIDDSGTVALAGLRFGNVFVAVQPPRGYGMDKTAIMHKPDLPPPYPYHAMYRWLAEPESAGGFGADAIVHMGKHGSLEWLPGKGVGLSEECYPDLFLGDLPLIYPFIVDDPGEGAAAKRRAHATIVDHLPPPMTTADTYGELDQLGRLVDEYYLLERTDPDKLPLLQQQIWALLREADLDKDLGALLNADNAEDHTHEWDPTTHEDGVPYSISDLSGNQFAHLVEAIHAYLHELGTAPIRDGLHVLGRPPDGERLIDTLLMLVRLANGTVPSLRTGIGAAYGLDVPEALRAPGQRPGVSLAALAAASGIPIESNASALDAVQELTRRVLRELDHVSFDAAHAERTVAGLLAGATDTDGQASVLETLAFVCERLVPALRRTDEEMLHILSALEGRYVPSGPSGAPTRGMAHVLPTGRNFYAVDPRSIPSSTAWQVGQDLAQGVVERYVREQGQPPRSVGISIWGTSAMRTSGDDIAQVLALLGVRPVWQPESRRVTGVEVIPLAELGRPRIDVVCRISGFFRDAFPHAIALIDDAVERVSSLDESPHDNFVRANRLAHAERLRVQGATEPDAWRDAGYRIFGSPPGTYGAGILQLIDERNWRDDADLAETYVNWGGYAYTRAEFGADARTAFRDALSTVAIAVKNQDNREHDIFDSDDYMQFHGGMIATIRALTGRNPQRYFGDTQDPDQPRVRSLQEEANRVFRSRVVNPKWIEAMKRHGYKGALEVAATVDYLFGYDATAQVVHDWQYEQVTQQYLLDESMAEFFAASNPWARRDIAERLLEAIQRGLWASPEAETRAAIESALLAAEGDIEGLGERPAEMGRVSG
ncbi:MAG: cobaltochelatase subunit CobN [Chloroflexi bacterium]|nr:cobaltochelatase subunit CobN [Chloroflexota bacterium]